MKPGSTTQMGTAGSMGRMRSPWAVAGYRRWRDSDALGGPSRGSEGSDVGRAVLVRGAEHHGGPGGDAAQGTDLVQQVLQRGRRADPHLEDVVLIARDAVAS